MRTRDYQHEPLDSWFDERGHLLVVGQAAHADSVRSINSLPPLPPFADHLFQPAGNHPAALCVEDAVILGGLFQRLRNRSQIKRLLSAFQDLRESRWEIIKGADEDKLGLVTMPPGPARDARDAMMRKEKEVGIQELSDDPDEYLRMSLEEFTNFGYDAVEEVDTWWVEWGVLLERVSGMESEDSEHAFEGQIRVESFATA